MTFPVPAAAMLLFVGVSSCCFTRGVKREGSDRTVPMLLGAAGRTADVELPAMRGVNGVREVRVEARVGLSGRPAVLLLLRSDDMPGLWQCYSIDKSGRRVMQDRRVEECQVRGGVGDLHVIATAGCVFLNKADVGAGRRSGIGRRWQVG